MIVMSFCALKLDHPVPLPVAAALSVFRRFKPKTSSSVGREKCSTAEPIENDGNPHSAGNASRAEYARRVAWVGFAAFVTCSVTAQAGEKTSGSLQSFRVLQGRTATQFLIGNSLINPPLGDFHGVTYFINDSTALSGTKSARDCVVSSWKFAGSENCGNQSLGVAAGEKCVPFHVLAARRVTKPKPKTGALIGYYIIGAYPGSNLERQFLKESGQAIFAGNSTRCPVAKPPISAEALEFPEADQSVPLETGTSLNDEMDTAGAQLTTILAGNSIAWPPSDDQECGMMDYFSPDGRIYTVRCFSKSGLRSHSDRPVFEVGTLGWKMVGKHFCIENVEKEGTFDDCDSIRLSAFLVQSPNGGSAAKRLHAYFVRSSAGHFSPPDRKPGLVVKGNPAGF